MKINDSLFSILWASTTELIKLFSQTLFHHLFLSLSRKTYINHTFVIQRSPQSTIDKDNDLVLANHYGIYMSKMTTDKSICSSHNLTFLFSFITYHRILNTSNMTGVSDVAGTANSSGGPEFTTCIQWCSFYLISSFVYIICGSLLSFYPFLLAIALSVLLRFTDSDYPFGIFKLNIFILIGLSLKYAKF